jgi:predicted nucleotidyltransferase
MTQKEVEKLVQDFLAQVKKKYKRDLIFVIHHGSWVTQEAQENSDIDILLGLKKVDQKELLILRKIKEQKKFNNFTVLVFSQLDLENYIPSGRQQFHYGAKLLYGKCPLPPPTHRELIEEIKEKANLIGFWSKYMFTHKNSFERIVDKLFWRVKESVICLKVFTQLKTGKFPLTKKELRENLESKKDIELVEILENWEKKKKVFLKNPDALMFKTLNFSQRILSRLENELKK